MRLAAALVVLIGLLGPSAWASAARTPSGSRADVLGALGVLHGWDSRRARAWARGDEDALRSLYLPGSAAARQDVRLLRSYTAHGFVVRRMVEQVFGVSLLRRSRTTLVIRVRDRIAGGTVDQGGRVVDLPSSRPAVRRIEFRRVAGSWEVATVGP